MAWIAIIIAGLLEVVWATAMKQSLGFSRLVPSIVTIAGMLGSVALLSWSMRTLALGTAYMVWTGIGAVGACAAGVLLFGEAASPMRMFAAVLIIGGIVLMKLAA